ncbi:DUF3375 domain-containing protein [Microbacterium jejuense]|nr:DUF3375 domain-containing protein [Microbacterium jejuense]
MAATLSAHLGTPGSRIAADELHERIDGDLETLRDHFVLSSKNAKAFCDDWRQAGILIRRPSGSARGETYELSAAGFGPPSNSSTNCETRTTMSSSSASSATIC